MAKRNQTWKQNLIPPGQIWAGAACSPTWATRNLGDESSSLHWGGIKTGEDSWRRRRGRRQEGEEMTKKERMGAVRSWQKVVVVSLGAALEPTKIHGDGGGGGGGQRREGEEVTREMPKKHRKEEKVVLQLT